MFGGTHFWKFCLLFWNYEHCNIMLCKIDIILCVLHLNFFHGRKYLFWNSYFEVKYLEKYFSYHEENILKSPLWNSGNYRYSILCKSECIIFISPLNKSFVHLRINLWLFFVETLGKICTIKHNYLPLMPALGKSTWNSHTCFELEAHKHIWFLMYYLE